MNIATLKEMPSSLNDACRKLDAAAAEIERLQAAKRRALSLADERAKEAVRLRAALTVIADWDQVNYSNEYEIGLRGIIRSITDRARDALNQQSETR